MLIYADESRQVLEKESFFFSIPIIGEEGKMLSFDWTSKGHRVLIQKLEGTQDAPKNKKPDGEWYTLVIKDGMLLEKQHNVWYDYGETDVVDGEVWVQEKEWPLPEDVAKKLLEHARVLTDHQNELENYQNEIQELESLFRSQAETFDVKI